MGTRLYPCTQNRRSIEILAGVPEGTYDRLDTFKAFIKERTVQDFTQCYNPKADELEITNIVASKARNNHIGKDAYLAFVLMPDGETIECDTGMQGEGMDGDFSFAVYNWMHDFRPNEAKLEEFLLFGWGRIQYIPKGKSDVGDETKDVEEMRLILNATLDPDLSFEEVTRTVRLCEGLAWG